MPELPEVESIRTSLRKSLINKRIISSNLFVFKALRNGNIENLVNQKIIEIKRIAKYLIFILEDYYLIFHLRLEGKFLIQNSNLKLPDFLLFSLNLSNQTSIYFQDFRKFATIDIFSNDVEFVKLPLFNKIGPEPFSVTGEYLFSKTRKLKSNIKNSLLSQKIISGLGNIYVDEVLYECKIHPLRTSNQINLNESNCIIEKTKEIFNNSISKQGSMIKSFKLLDLEPTYQNHLNVHQQLGKECGYNQKVIKIKVSGRGTFLCDEYQK